jgi:GTP-binding protein
MYDSAEFVKGCVEWDQLPDDGRPEVAFIGRSNVGKSSLLNALLKRKQIAYTSKKPGKTRELNYFLVDGDVYFVDLPGYGFAKVPTHVRKKWAGLIERYLTERPPLAGVVHLIDSRHPPMANDEDLIDFMRGSGVPYLIALTKSDKLSGNQRTNRVRRVNEQLADVGLSVPVILTSAQDKRGIRELRTWIGDLV